MNIQHFQFVFQSNRTHIQHSTALSMRLMKAYTVTQPGRGGKARANKARTKAPQVAPQGSPQGAPQENLYVHVFFEIFGICLHFLSNFKVSGVKTVFFELLHTKPCRTI